MDLEDPQSSTAAQGSPILDPDPDVSCDTYMSDEGSAGAQAPGRRGVRRAEPRSPGRVARSDEETEQDAMQMAHDQAPQSSNDEQTVEGERSKARRRRRNVVRRKKKRLGWAAKEEGASP